MPTDPPSLRCVITGHDDIGRSCVVRDERLPFLALSRAGAHAASVFTTGTFPADNAAACDDLPAPEAGMRSGTFARMLCFEPGVAPRPHATATLDYAVVVAGTIQMALDSGTVELGVGDVLVQRGTLHNWVNPGPLPCRIFVVLTAAKPLAHS